MIEMRCEDLTDLIEPWAAGELTPSPPEAAHLRTCPSCARALAMARRVEQELASMTWATVPAGFAQDVTRRIQADGWRTEELVDRVFNAAVAAVAAMTVGGIWLALEWTGMIAVIGDSLALAGTALSRSAAELPMEPLLYAAATIAGVAAVLIWRWREGDEFL
jgi:anti-sigma factor RsiW